MRIKKAIITAAGYGTRFFPITKTIQKEMLPILDRPTIDFVVNDCIEAGIEEIIFVVKPSDTQIKDFYSESKNIKDYLDRMNKPQKYEKIKNLHTKAKFTYVHQTKDDPYGTATPVKLCKKYVENEDAFLVFMGDDFVFNKDGESEAKKMINKFSKGNYEALVTFIKRSKEEIVRYGAAKYEEKTGEKILKNVIEKPEPHEIPSTLANISKYIFTPKVFDILENQEINPKRNELEITDTLKKTIEKGDVVIYTPNGEYLDSGNVFLWLRANLLVAKSDQAIYSKLKDFIADEF